MGVSRRYRPLIDGLARVSCSGWKASALAVATRLGISDFIIGATVVGRHAGLAAALGATFLANLLLAGLAGLCLLSQGLGPAGSFAFGFELATRVQALDSFMGSGPAGSFAHTDLFLLQHAWSYDRHASVVNVFQRRSDGTFNHVAVLAAKNGASLGRAISRFSQPRAPGGTQPHRVTERSQRSRDGPHARYERQPIAPLRRRR